MNVNNKKLENKVAIITGATSGMGEGIAKLFASEGAKVVVNGRDEKRGAKVVKEITNNGGEAIFVEAPVENADAVKNMVKKTCEKFGKVDILVPNAGVLGIGSVTEIPLDVWNETININFNGVFYLCRFGIPEMIKAGGGAIMIVASIGSFKVFPNHPAYCSTKTALVALAKNMALDYARYKIRVNCLCPGQVDTPLLWNSAAAFPNPKTIVQETIDKNPLKRLGTPDDIAKAALFLVSEDSSWITGTSLIIDGGIMLTS